MGYRLPSGCAGVASPPAAVPVATLLALLSLVLVDLARARPPVGYSGNRMQFRALVAWLKLTQPVARLWGRARHAAGAHRGVERPVALPGPARVAAGGV